MTRIASEDVMRFVDYECASSYEDFLIDVRTGLRSLKFRVDMLLLNGGIEGWKDEYRVGRVVVSKGSGGLIEFTVPPVVSEGGVCSMALDVVPAFLSDVRRRVERFMFRRFSVVERMFLRRLMNIDVRTPVGEGRSYWMITDVDREAFRRIRSYVRNTGYGGFGSTGNISVPVPSRKGVSLVISMSEASDFFRAEDRERAERMIRQVSIARMQAGELLRAIRSISEDTARPPSPPSPIPPPPPPPPPSEPAASDRAAPGDEVAYANAGASAASSSASSASSSPSSSSSSSRTVELSDLATYRFDGSSVSVRTDPGGTITATVPVDREGVSGVSVHNPRIDVDTGISEEFMTYGNPSRMFEFRHMDAVKVSLVRDTSMRAERRVGADIAASLAPPEFYDAGVSSAAATATTHIREVLDVAVFDREVFDDVVDAAAKYMTR